MTILAHKQLHLCSANRELWAYDVCLWTSKPPPFKSFKNTRPYQVKNWLPEIPYFEVAIGVSWIDKEPWPKCRSPEGQFLVDHQVMTSPRALRFKNTCHMAMLLYFPQTLSQQQKKLVFTYQIIDEGVWRLPFLVTTSRDFQFWMAWPWIVDLIFRTATFRGNGLTPNPTNRWRNVPPKIPKQTRQCFAVPTPDITCPIKLSDVSEIWEICVSTAWRWLKMLKLWHEAHEMAGIPLSFQKHTTLCAT